MSIVIPVGVDTANTSYLDMAAGSEWVFLSLSRCRCPFILTHHYLLFRFVHFLVASAEGSASVVRFFHHRFRSLICLWLSHQKHALLLLQKKKNHFSVEHKLFSSCSFLNNGSIWRLKLSRSKTENKPIKPINTIKVICMTSESIQNLYVRNRKFKVL